MDKRTRQIIATEFGRCNARYILRVTDTLLRDERDQRTRDRLNEIRAAALRIEHQDVCDA